jgi:hypothetical protein
MIGNRIRELREKDNILLRQLAAKLDIDTPCSAKWSVATAYSGRKTL